MRRDPIKSTARTLEIFELFQETREPLRLTYIFERLQYPQSSTTTLLKSMVTLGYLNYDRRTRTYFPTPRVAALGDWINHHIFGSGELEALVQRVAEATDETVAVSSQNDIFIQHIRVRAANHPEKMPPPEGSMQLLTESSAGLALLSQMPSKEVDKLCRHIGIHAAARGGRIDIPELKLQLDWVRREGYSLVTGFPHPLSAGIAMPLPRNPRGIPLTLGVGALNSRLVSRKSEIIGIMREAIQSYSTFLRESERNTQTLLAEAAS